MIIRVKILHAGPEKWTFEGEWNPKYEGGANVVEIRFENGALLFRGDILKAIDWIMGMLPKK